jgi:hypothetical protein
MGPWDNVIPADTPRWLRVAALYELRNIKESTPARCYQCENRINAATSGL